MRRILLFCFLLAFGYMPALGSSAPRFPKRFTRDEKIEALSRVWAEVKYNFAYIDYVDFDIDSLYRATLPRVIASKNDVEFMDELRRFMVCFNDGHTNVGYPSYNWSRFHDFAPARFEEIGGRYYLGYLTEDSGLDSLALGAELVEIEGEPTREYVRRNYYPLITGGSERMKANMATTNYIGAGVAGSRFCGVLRLRDGSEKRFSMRCEMLRRSRKGKTLRTWGWADFRRGRNATLTCDSLTGGRIAWLDIRRFDEEEIPQLERMLDSLCERAEGLVIDLRYCPGGSSLVGDILLRRLVDADSIAAYKALTRTGNAYGRSQGNWQPEYEAYYTDRAFDTLPAEMLRIDRSRVLRMPTVILTGKHTMSGAETFLIQLYEYPGRPAIIGQRTAGTTGSPLVVELPHDAWVRICTIKYLYPENGRPFGAEGIVPDEELAPTLEDYIEGRDRVLERAAEIILEKL